MLFLLDLFHYCIRIRINGCISDLQKKTRHSEGKTLVIKYIRELTLKNCSRNMNKFFANYLAIYLFIYYLFICLFICLFIIYCLFVIYCLLFIYLSHNQKQPQAILSFIYYLYMYSHLRWTKGLVIGTMKKQTQIIHS